MFFIEKIKNFSIFLKKSILFFINIKKNNYFVNEKVYNERVDICRNCPKKIYTKKNYFFFKTEVCDIKRGGCGCYIKKKAKIEFEDCPYNFW